MLKQIYRGVFAQHCV